MTENTTKLKKKKPLERYIHRQIEIGPYLGGLERKRYITWSAGLPDGRMLMVVQQVRTNRLSNEKQNPVVYKETFVMRGHMCSMDAHKKILISTGHALYHMIKRELDMISRPVVKVCGECESDKNPDWQTLDIGNCAETIGRWREQVLYTLAVEYQVRDWTEVLAELAEIDKWQAAEDAAEEAEKAAQQAPIEQGGVAISGRQQR